MSSRCEWFACFLILFTWDASVASLFC